VAASAGFNLYFRHFTSYPRVYGALGGFIILMLWIYTANVILLIGAETDRAIEMLASEMRPQ
jgi:membrane protein